MHLKENLRKFVASFASFIEIAISAIVLIAIAISAVHIIGDAFKLVGDADIHETFGIFLHHALDLIVGVEFIKMLCRHTPGSTIEVLLFAIARQMIVEHTSPIENLVTIVTIALIFAIRKFLFVPTFGSGTHDHPEAEKAPAAAVPVSSPAQDA